MSNVVLYLGVKRKHSWIRYYFIWLIVPRGKNNMKFKIK